MSSLAMVPVSKAQENVTSARPKPSAAERAAVFGSMALFILTFPISVFFVFKKVTEYERAVIFRLGRLRSGGARGPGLFFVLPCTDDYFMVDLRTITFDVPCQEILTKDCVTVAVDAVVFYSVANPLSAILNIVSYSYSTRTLAATTLRNVMGTCNLAEILAQRESLAAIMQGTLDEATERWGIKVERVEIKDVRLPAQLQRAMAAEAEAAREARAKVIAAEGELKASKALREAATIMSSNPVTLQLRYLQTLGSISGATQSTIIFPLPVNFFGHS
uniref:Band 7 domain-containing protein n=1 Tax=Graphocephala atropunctata TaxID=36148 RepID=A0A1B6K8N3_9HEMI